jgi:hypothetical protein
VEAETRAASGLLTHWVTYLLEVSRINLCSVAVVAEEMYGGSDMCFKQHAEASRMCKGLGERS